MPNVIEELNKLIQRLEMMFQVQTHEVVQDLKKIREMIENPVSIEPQKEIKQEEQPKLEKASETTETVVEMKEETIITPTIQEPIEETKEEKGETKEEIVKRYIEKFQKKPFA